MGLPATDFDIVGSYNNQRISEIDSERSVNCFEYRDPLAKKPKSLRGTSGLNNSGFVFTSATGGFRGDFVFLGQQYIVIGAYAFLIEANGTVVKLSSSIDTTQTYVGINGNEFQVIFVTGGAGYVLRRAQDPRAGHAHPAENLPRHLLPLLEKPQVGETATRQKLLRTAAGPARRAGDSLLTARRNLQTGPGRACYPWPGAYIVSPL